MKDDLNRLIDALLERARGVAEELINDLATGDVRPAASATEMPEPRSLSSKQEVIVFVGGVVFGPDPDYPGQWSTGAARDGNGMPWSELLEYARRHRSTITVFDERR